MTTLKKNEKDTFGVFKMSDRLVLQKDQ
jgi:hypothetical protein